MALTQMQITVEQDMEGCLFCAVRPAEGGKRKHQSLRVTFLDAHGTVKVPEKYQVAAFCTDGELCFTQPVKSDLFGSKDLRVLVPFQVLDWMSTGRLLTVRIERLEEDGTVSAAGELPLVINSGKRAVAYSDHIYLSLFPQMEDAAAKRAFARRYIQEGKLEEGALLAQALGQMVQRGETGEEEYILWLLYQSPAFAGHSENQAKEWLQAAAAKRYPEAIRDQVVLGQEADCPEPEQAGEAVAPTDPASLLEQYRQLRDEDPQKAEECLIQAVEGGDDGAVGEWERHCYQTLLLGGEPDQFIARLKASAEHGSLSALYRLFTIYYTGECLQVEVRRDKRAALDYLRQAADAGLALACYRMWQTFEDGNDLLIKPEEAVELLTRAANSGDPEALNDLGELFVTGRIVQKDGAKGIELIQRAAELGCVSAQMRVYHMWLVGRYYDMLFDIDRERAYGLLLRYADEGNPRAQLCIWENYKNGNPMLLTRFEALAYLTTAAGQEDREAMFELATVDLAGLYRDVDEQEGRRLLERGAKLGCGNAQFALFQLYYTGSYLALTTAVNKERAYKWILRAGRTNPAAQVELWRMFIAGNEMNLEAEEALALLRDAARNRYGDALEATATLFAKGDYLPKDEAQVIRYLELGAKQRHPLSLYRLYEGYGQGRLEEVALPKDLEKAHRMLLLSAQLGYAPACREVCRLFEEGNPIQVDRCFVRECQRLAESCPKERKSVKALQRRGEIAASIEAVEAESAADGE